MNSDTGRTGYSGASSEAIGAHYDLGTEFFQLWLDESLTYSCALWDGVDSLHEAQVRKLDFHMRNAEAAGAARILDVGCGWGSLLNRAVQLFGVRHAVGLTLSKRQFEYSQARPHNGIEVRLENWSDHHPERPYDAAFCIGTLEHCARTDLDCKAKIDAYASFFEACRNWLTNGRCLSLQSICFGTLRELDPFIRDEIWPESNLPLLHEIVTAANGLFEIESIVLGSEDYARTCKAWADNLSRRRSDASSLVGEKTVESYLRFLRMSSRAFETGALCLYRIKFRCAGKQPTSL